MLSLYFLLLSILVVGNKYYLSEIFLVVSIIFISPKLKLESSYKFLFSLLYFLISLFFKDFKQILYILFFLVYINFKFPVFKLSRSVVVNVLLVNLIYGYILYIATLMFGVEFSSSFLDTGIYGQRSGEIRGISDYVFSGISLPRFYGFTAEPSLYSLFTLLALIFLKQENHNLKEGVVNSWLSVLIVLSIFLSMSLTGIVGIIFYSFSGVRRSSHLVMYFVLTLILLLLLSKFSFFDALISRQFGRILDIWNLTDGSFFIRFVVPFKSLVVFSNDFTSVLFGMTRGSLESYLNSLSFIFDYGEGSTEFNGTKGNSLVLMILLFGITLTLIVFNEFLKLQSVLLKFCFLLLFLVNSFLLSFGFIGSLIFIKILSTYKYKNGG